MNPLLFLGASSSGFRYGSARPGVEPFDPAGRRLYLTLILRHRVPVRGFTLRAASGRLALRHGEPTPPAMLAA